MRSTRFSIRLSSISVMTLALLAGSLSAQETSATFSSDGRLIVKGTQALSNGCLSLGFAVPGSPNGVPELTNAQPVTIEIRHSGDEVCAQMVSMEDFQVEAPNMLGKPFVVLFKTYVGFPEGTPEAVLYTSGEILSKISSE